MSETLRHENDDYEADDEAMKHDESGWRENERRERERERARERSRERERERERWREKKIEGERERERKRYFETYKKLFCTRNSKKQYF